MAGLIFDQAGNLYGTTYFGGADETGVVFKLTPNADGSWTQSVLHSFAGDDGSQPFADLIFDKAGDLYGTTVFGGTYGYGVVFKLTPNEDGSWTESVLHDFTGGKDGGEPEAGLIFDQAGNLYGTTYFGGAFEEGTVFSLTPKGDGSWTETVLHDFTGGRDGREPCAGLLFDATGSLYGTTQYGGAYAYGVVFKLSPNGDGAWTEKVLHHLRGFSGGDGANPRAGLVFDAAGNLYGTTYAGADYGYGVVFKLIPSADGKWRERVLHVFKNHPGASPYARLVVDEAGNLYGTTYGDGTATRGSVFEITP